MLSLIRHFLARAPALLAALCLFPSTVVSAAAPPPTAAGVLRRLSQQVHPFLNVSTTPLALGLFAADGAHPSNPSDSGTTSQAKQESDPVKKPEDPKKLKSGKKPAESEESVPAQTPWVATSALAKVVEAAGFTYDAQQDIIVSRMNAWQRGFGYCWAYDVGSPVIRCIIDCEPLYFYYGGKEWMIELWKGQYGLESGAEIGLYNREPATGLFAKIRNKAPGRFFNCAGNAERLLMKFSLHRKGVKLLTRGPELHWWLTGFKWGVYSEPEELTMDVSITLANAAMRDAFRGALSERGYMAVKVSGNTVSFTFDKPYFKQPVPRAVGRGAAQALNAKTVDDYVAGLKLAGLSSNDPNAITVEKAKQAYDAVVDQLKIFLKTGASRKK